MHLIYYGKNVLDLHGLSTPVTIALGSGALYGLFRGFVDLMFVLRGGDLFASPRRRSPGPPPPAK
jgi:hypothetical protein